MPRLHTIVFLLVAAVFCLKELGPGKLCDTGSICWMQDLDEDGSPAQDSEDDSDEKTEKDPFYTPTLIPEIAFGNSGQLQYRSFCESRLSSPFFVIQLPPPELA